MARKPLSRSAANADQYTPLPRGKLGAIPLTMDDTRPDPKVLSPVRDCQNSDG